VTALLWLRRDLRVHDHPALHAALAAAEHVVPVFCFDPRILGGRHASGPRTQFMLDCLADLDRSLRERGGALVVRRGPPERELAALAEEVGAREVHFSFDTTAYARRRGERVHAALGAAGLALHGHPGVNVVEDARAQRTGAGKPYTVFTPFYKSCLKAPHREVLPAPERVPLPEGLDPGVLPSLEDLGLSERVPHAIPAGESQARARLVAFVEGPIEGYGSGQDRMGADRTSRLSPYLHFGCLSPREVLEHASGEGQGPERFRRQLYWADFYNHVIHHFPENAREEFQERFRGTLEWPGTDEHFRAWAEGRTGYPLVDAGMRQLAAEGWMHNRARLVVGSFLIKDLGVDWRRGEAHFMRLLIDGDEAVNNGNWQWIASTGTDPAPFFRRLYNPTRQMETHDPKGAYVRRYVPELRDVPDEHIREPWAMPGEVQEAAGCAIGRDYPAPIVDHAEARRAAAERYRVAIGAGGGARAESNRL